MFLSTGEETGHEDCSFCHESRPVRLEKAIFQSLLFLPDPVADGDKYKSFHEI